MASKNEQLRRSEPPEQASRSPYRVWRFVVISGGKTRAPSGVYPSAHSAAADSPMEFSWSRVSILRLASVKALL